LFTKISECRICKNKNLVQVVDLGEQHMTGVFPFSKDMNKVTKGPLRLVKCHGEGDICGLVQLEHTYNLAEMYGENYGYRSGLNGSMVKHLKSKVEKITSFVALTSGDLVIDIGSNDGTTLGFYPENLSIVGVDPTGTKFKKYYKPHVALIPDFFSNSLIKKVYGAKKAKVITSFSMFYDLDEPVKFAAEVASVLDEKEGVWVFEQSYMPLMVERNSYDTICHEHLEYYGLKQIEFIAKKAGLKIIDVEFNDINGGSFSVVAALQNSARQPNHDKVNSVLATEVEAGYLTLKPYEAFFDRIKESKKNLVDFVKQANLSGKKVYGLGASTKGNVVLQYCGFTEQDIVGIADVNPDKFGAFTPGSCIPIQDEKKILADKPDYLLVLPWHFREFFVTNPAFKNNNLLFPLPNIEIVAVK